LKDLVPKILFTLSERSTEFSLKQVWIFISSTSQCKICNPFYFLFASMDVNGISS